MNVTRTRKFNGKIYDFDSSWALKRHAKARAKTLRNRGELARVVKSSKMFALGGRWSVYSR